ncbi:MAG: DUF4097 family beta strand repeat-containing protein [Cellulophaga sp.]
MKKIQMIILFVLCGITANAQKSFKQSLNGIKKVIIESNAQLSITTVVANELVISEGIECDDCDEDEKHEKHNHDNHGQGNDRAKGLTALYPGGEDTTDGFGLNIKKDGDVLRIIDLKSNFQRGGLSFALPKTIDISVNCGNMGRVRMEKFSSEIEVISNIGHVHLIDVTGPITASSSTGTIHVEFVSVNQKSPISIRSSTGDIDVSLPENTKANLEMKTTMGTVYTNFKLTKPSKDGMNAVGGQRRIENVLNGGGVQIKLSSSIGNVYLRKRK